jgi:hypothetical protein
MKQYTPPLSIAPFLISDKFINLIVGPVGSTKTTAALIKIVYEAKRVAPCFDGIRRSRCVVIRNTRQMLADTTIPDFLKWFGEYGIFEKSAMKFLLKIDDVECEVLFRGLDDSNDVRRLLSLQLSFGVMDEFREINPDVFDALTGRLGRYPDKTMNGVGCCELIKDKDGNESTHQIHKVWGATNPPDYDTHWEEFLNEPADNAAVFLQPSGLSPEADWIEFLPDGYYENLAEGKSEAWIDVYVHGKFGASLSGKPVFRSFDRDTHVAEQALAPNKSSAQPVIIGFDCTGLNPAAVIGQLGFEGKLYVYDCMYAVDMGAIRFIREVLKPLLTNKYAGAKVMVVIDPAGMSRGADERNVADMLKAEGLAVKPARTNGISARIGAVEQFLTRMVDGKPGFMVDPECGELIQALAGKYRFKINTKGETADTPEKSHPWADIVDALQYLCLHADGGTMFGITQRTGRPEIKPAPHRWAV